MGPILNVYPEPIESYPSLQYRLNLSDRYVRGPFLKIKAWLSKKGMGLAGDNVGKMHKEMKIVKLGRDYYR